MYKNPATPFGADNLIVQMNHYGAHGSQRTLSHSNFETWAKQMQNTVSQLVDNDMQLQSDIAQLAQLFEGAKSFLEYVAANYPDIIAEYHAGTRAKVRLEAGADNGNGVTTGG